jgi:hypothetical protein
VEASLQKWLFNGIDFIMGRQISYFWIISEPYLDLLNLGSALRSKSSVAQTQLSYFLPGHPQNCFGEMKWNFISHGMFIPSPSHTEFPYRVV